ncbi:MULTISPECIES: GcrA family cell cycle regulator [unclassified Aureimonas]|uniref:GcrA family cell cycle regulator n=1 Tax=unclassified Aureimonas TaxID=2615206 RepID=UPI0006FE1191|nr:MULTISPECIES: GcrA family cell cycle regulator [unclassified Aureimonas]KQT52163.1 GcrA cell cycle regulator [Aureimonas sp. Leaf427]KQT70670.1 GcrA cell cycle regulator [Aureimonas sp. Leaf460]
MGWTDERVELLSKLWSEGLSASQIATQLGGVTRNAVIGKVHRLKLEGRARPASSGVLAASELVGADELNTVIVEESDVSVEEAVVIPATLRVVASPSAPRSAPRVDGATAFKIEPDEELVIGDLQPRVPGEVVPISRNLTLVQLSDRTCKWPLGDPLQADFRFCGNHSNDASPYCAYHARLAFQPVSERRRVR